MKKWMLLVLVLAMVVSGAISGISFQSTLSGMRSVVRGDPGTFILLKNELYLLAWPAGDGAWAFANLTKAGNPIRDLSLYVNGTKVDTVTMSTFVAQLERDGWQPISSEALPASITGALGSYVSYLMAIGARSLPTLWMFPVILIQPTPAGVIQ